MTPLAVKIVWVCIVILIVMLLIMFIILCYGFLPTNDIISEIHHLDVSKMKTGDIIGNQMGVQFLLQSMIRSKFGHVGVIYVDPDTRQVYVLEGVNKKDIKWGFSMVPIHRWVHYLRRNEYICYLPINKEADSETLLKTFKEIIKYSELDWPNRAWKRFFYMSPYTPKDLTLGNRMTCIEATIYSLQEAGVFAKEYDCSSFLTHQLLYGGIKTINGYSYNKPIRIDLRSQQVCDI